MMGRNLGAQVQKRTSGWTCLRVAKVPEVKACMVSTKVYPWELGQSLATILPHSSKGGYPRLVIQHHGPVLNMRAPPNPRSCQSRGAAQSS